jgi:hypothetical protein
VEVDAVMLTTSLATPIVLACLGLQPCQPQLTLPDRLVASSSPGVPVTVTRAPEDRIAVDARPLELAVHQTNIRHIPARAQNRRAQAGFTRGSSTGATKAMLVMLGAVGGIYAGAYLGAALDDSSDGEAAFIGIPIGAAIGGWAVWNLVR